MLGGGGGARLVAHVAPRLLEAAGRRIVDERAALPRWYHVALRLREDVPALFDTIKVRHDGSPHCRRLQLTRARARRPRRKPAAAPERLSRPFKWQVEVDVEPLFIRSGANARTTVAQTSATAIFVP